MFKQDAEKINLKFQSLALIFSGLLWGFVIWNISGISNFGHYGIEQLTEKQIITSWLFLPICPAFTVFCNLAIGKLFFKQKTWRSRILAVIISFNICYNLFSFTKSVLIDSSTFLTAELSFPIFAAVLILMNIFVCSLTIFTFLIFFAVSKLFIRKKLP